MCEAPWSHKCQAQDLAVIILWKNKPRDICRRCWQKCPQNLEWGKRARSRKAVKKELASAKYKKPSDKPVKCRISKDTIDYVPFGKHAWIRKDVAERLKKEKS